MCKAPNRLRAYGSRDREERRHRHSRINLPDYHPSILETIRAGVMGASWTGAAASIAIKSYFLTLY